MNELTIIFLFISGLAVGSFINVIVYRLNHDLSPFKGRSFCPECKKKINWRDNFPLLSFILLKGRCRFCHSPISWQYPLVELATGVLSVLVVFHLAGVEVVASSPPRWPEGLLRLGGVFYYLLITYALIAIFVSDLRYQIIPDKIVFPAMGVAIIFRFASWFHLRGVFLRNSFPTALGAAAFFLALILITRGKGMGLGDVKLAGLMGLILGWPKIAVALWLAFLTGAIGGVILVLIGKKRFSGRIPFGPFLTGATWVSLIWGEIIWQLWWKRLLGI